MILIMGDRKQAIINDFNRFLAPTIEIVGLVF
jgi:hypothetical protein